MDTEKSKYDTPSQKMAGEPGSAGATAQDILERGTEVYGQVEQLQCRQVAQCGRYRTR